MIYLSTRHRSQGVKQSEQYDCRVTKNDKDNGCKLCAVADRIHCTL